jgi:hypothetical protein
LVAEERRGKTKIVIRSYTFTLTHTYSLHIHIGEATHNIYAYTFIYYIHSSQIDILHAYISIFLFILWVHEGNLSKKKKKLLKKNFSTQI